MIGLQHKFGTNICVKEVLIGPSNAREEMARIPVTKHSQTDKCAKMNTLALLELSRHSAKPLLQSAKGTQ